MNEPSPIILSSPDAGSRGAGDAIRRARESQGMTLEALAAMIKVTPAKLESLELGRYDLLPDANFTRALAMTVCRALKLDPGEVLAALPAARPAALAEGKPPLNQPFKEARGGSPLFDRHAVDLKGLLTLKYLAPAVLLISALVIYALPDSAVDVPGWLKPSSSPESSSTGSSRGATAPQAISASAVVTEQVTSLPQAAGASLPVPSLKLDAAEPASGAVATAGAGAAPALPAGGQPAGPAIASAALPPAATLSSPVTSSTNAAALTSAPLTIVLTSPSWIEVRDAQGQRLFGRLAQAGENIALVGTAPLQVRIGYVAGVQMRFKGQPVDLSSFSRNNVARLELK